MSTQVDMSQLIPADKLSGDDEEETKLLNDSFAEARRYIGSFQWCQRVRESYFGLGVGGVVAVFLVRIEPAGGADEWLWVVTGDLPSAYFVTDQAPTPVAALDVYCKLMDEWIQAVRDGRDLSDVFPVGAASEENVVMLEKRVALLRGEVIPAFS